MPFRLIRQGQCSSPSTASFPVFEIMNATTRLLLRLSDSYDANSPVYQKPMKSLRRMIE